MFREVDWFHKCEDQDHLWPKIQLKPGLKFQHLIFANYIEEIKFLLHKNVHQKIWEFANRFSFIFFASLPCFSSNNGWGIYHLQIDLRTSWLTHHQIQGHQQLLGHHPKPPSVWISTWILPWFSGAVNSFWFENLKMKKGALVIKMICINCPEVLTVRLLQLLFSLDVLHQFKGHCRNQVKCHFSNSTKLPDINWGSKQINLNRLSRSCWHLKALILHAMAVVEANS